MLKAILFDLDDTLIDWSEMTEDWDTMQLRHLDGVFDYLCQHHPLTDRNAYVHEFYQRTMNAWTSARMTLVAPSLPEVLLEAAHAVGVPQGRITSRACMEAYRWGVLPGARLFPEVREMLGQFYKRGLKLGIITNAYQPMWARDVELEHFALSEFFPDCRFSAADHGYLKPHPSIFEAAMKRLGTKPEETVFVGDNLEADIAGAKQAGIHAVLRLLRRRPVALDGSIQPDSTIQSLDELPAIFDHYFPGW